MAAAMGSPPGQNQPAAVALAGLAWLLRPSGLLPGVSTTVLVCGQALCGLGLATAWIPRAVLLLPCWLVAAVPAGLAWHSELWVVAWQGSGHARGGSATEPLPRAAPQEGMEAEGVKRRWASACVVGGLWTHISQNVVCRQG